jgi:hypothetical protein
MRRADTCRPPSGAESGAIPTHVCDDNGYPKDPMSRHGQ